jgi:hypothetical protein
MNPAFGPTLFKRGFMKKIKKILKIKKETATAIPKTEKAMLPKLEKRIR